MLSILMSSYRYIRWLSGCPKQWHKTGSGIFCYKYNIRDRAGAWLVSINYRCSTSFMVYVNRRCTRYDTPDDAPDDTQPVTRQIMHQFKPQMTHYMMFTRWRTIGCLPYMTCAIWSIREGCQITHHIIFISHQVIRCDTWWHMPAVTPEEAPNDAALCQVSVVSWNSSDADEVQSTKLRRHKMATGVRKGLHDMADVTNHGGRWTWLRHRVLVI